MDDAFSAGSENIFPWIPVTIASSVGFPIFPHPLVNISSRTLHTTANTRSLSTVQPRKLFGVAPQSIALQLSIGCTALPKRNLPDIDESLFLAPISSAGFYASAFPTELG